MKNDTDKNVNKEISTLVGNLFSNKPITKKDIERIKKIKNGGIKNGRNKTK